MKIKFNNWYSESNIYFMGVENEQLVRGMALWQWARFGRNGTKLPLRLMDLKANQKNTPLFRAQ